MNSKNMFLDLTMQIADIKIQLALKRKATANNKIRIHDKHTGIIYKSKNNTYQSMLKKGELKELVDMGIFGKEPIKNTFGIYALLRAWPDRFEEVHETRKRHHDSQLKRLEWKPSEIFEMARCDLLHFKA